ncbi:polysaccharide biosynthesis/export family protein [Luteolibacter sp. LG18]|uniref:polysaccharide biosynthesis/export family protein n=1 Tax=Luteolibacter sp. LG18 TaxID=2819286 RepID=UPI002B29BE7F|nr:polysaccharide export protein [Luteolibacter sp. LG18]
MNPFRILLALLACLPFVVRAAEENAGKASGVIGRLDTVEITVFREDELATRGQLSADGTITMPLIGAVRLQGLTTDQAGKAIEQKLKDGYLVRPQVSVSIGARVRRTITVLGQAQNPGVFELPANRQLTLVEAIGMAGGVTRIGNARKLTLKRGGEVQQVDLKEITTGKAKDIPLRDGDVVNIPESLF